MRSLVSLVLVIIMLVGGLPSSYHGVVAVAGAPSPIPLITATIRPAPMPPATPTPNATVIPTPTPAPAVSPVPTRSPAAPPDVSPTLALDTPSSSIVVETNQGQATVYLDGVYSGETAGSSAPYLFLIREVKNGDHLIRLTKPGYLGHSETVRLAGSDARVMINLMPSGSLKLPPGPVPSAGIIQDRQSPPPVGQVTPQTPLQPDLSEPVFSGSISEQLTRFLVHVEFPDAGSKAGALNPVSLAPWQEQLRNRQRQVRDHLSGLKSSGQIAGFNLAEKGNYFEVQAYPQALALLRSLPGVAAVEAATGESIRKAEAAYYSKLQSLGNAATESSRLVIRPKAIPQTLTPGLLVRLYGSEVNGHIAPNTPWTLTTKDASQTIRSTASGTSDASGDFFTYVSTGILPGDILQLVPQTGQTITLTAVDLTAQIDVATDTVQGNGPSNSSLVLVAPGYSLTVTTDAQGHYAANFSGNTTIKRGDLIYINYSTPEGNQIYRYLITPVLSVRVNSGHVEGFTTPSTSLTLTLKDTAQTVKATANLNSNSDGYFATEFKDQNNNLVIIMPGYIIQMVPLTGETITVSTVDLTAQVNLITDVVAGKGPANSTLVVSVSAYPLTVTTGAQGNYTANFSGKVTIMRGNAIDVRYYNADSNLISFSMFVPQITVRMNPGSVTGYSTPNTPLTLTLKDTAQAVKATASLTSDSVGYFSTDLRGQDGKGIMLSPGYTVQMAPQTGEGLTVNVVEMTAQANIAADVVTGKGPPNSSLTVMAGYIPLGVNTDAQGNYNGNFLGKADIKRGNPLSVIYYNQDFNVVIFNTVIPMLNITINSNYIYGYTTPGSPFTLTLKDSSAVTIATASSTSSPEGYLSAYFADQNNKPAFVQSGYVVQIMPQTGESLAVTVPELTAQANIITDIVQGKGPAGRSLTVSASRSYPNSASITVIPDSQGNYTADFSGKVDIKRGSGLAVNYSDPEGNLFIFSAAVPLLIIRINSSSVSGYATTTNTPVTLTLRDASGVTKASASLTSGYGGYYSTNFKDQGGNPVNVLLGHTVQMTPQTGEALTITADLTARFDPTTHVVSGKSPPSTSVTIYALGYASGYTLTVNSDAQGNYAADFSDKKDVGRGAWFQLACTDAGGNQESLLYVAPILAAYLNTTYIYGITTPSTPVTLTIRDSSATIKKQITMTSDPLGVFATGFNYDGSNDPGSVLPGYVIQMTPETGETLVLAVAELTAWANVATDVVQGKGPANSSLTITITGSGQSSMTVTTDAQGNYTANFAGKTDIRRGNSMSITYYNADGNRLYASLVVPGLSVQLYSSYVSGYTTPGTRATLTLRDAGQTVKATATLAPSSSGWISTNLVDATNAPAIILPGYRVEMVPVAGETLSVTVPEITAQADIVNDVVRGKGPPGSSLSVIAGRYSLTVSTDAQGNYSANFHGIGDIMRGDFVELSYSNPDDNGVYFYFDIPLLKVQLNSASLSGYSTPNTLVSLTLKDTTQAVKAAVTAMTASQGSFYVTFRDSSNNDVPVLPGYVVQMSPQTGEALTVVAVDMAAQVNLATGAIQGKGPPNSSLKVSVMDFTANVTTDSQGNYSTNYSGAMTIQRGSNVGVSYSNPDGNQVSLSFYIPLLAVRAGSSSVYGYANARTQLSLTLKDPSGAVKAATTISSQSSGYFSIRFMDRNNGQVVIMPGDAVQMIPQAGETLTVTAAPLTGRANAAGNKVMGKGPPNSSLTVVSGVNSSVTTTDAQGNYSTNISGNVPPMPVGVLASIDVRYFDATGNRVYVQFIQPFLSISPAASYVAGYSTPNSPLTITLKDSAQLQKATVSIKSGDNGSFSAYFTDQSGAYMPALPGYVVQVTPETGDALNMTVVALTAEANLDTDIVQGRGPANSLLDGSVYTPGVTSSPSLSAYTDRQGNYSVNLSGRTDVRRGSRIGISYRDTNGYATYLSFTIPLLQLIVNRGSALGYTTANVPLTLTLKDASQTIRATVNKISSPTGFFSADFLDTGGNPIPILSGYSVQMEPRSGETLIVTAAELIADVNVDTDTVRGKGSPDSSLYVLAYKYPPPQAPAYCLNSSPYGVTLASTTDGQGNYIAGFAGLIDIKAGDWIVVFYPTPEGNQLSVYLQATSVQLKLNGSVVRGNVDPNVVLKVVLQDAGGATKASISVTSNAAGVFYADLKDKDGNAVSIDPGNLVQVILPGNRTIAVNAVALAPRVQLASSTIQGTGPAGAIIYAVAKGYSKSVSSDPQGGFTADFTGLVNILPGDPLEVQYYDPDGNQVYLPFNAFDESQIESNLRAEVVLTPSLDQGGYAILRAAITGFNDAATGVSYSISDGIVGYDAYLTYQAAGVKAVSVTNLAPFTIVTYDLNTSGGTRTNLSASGGTPARGFPLSMAEIRFSLLGTKNDSYSVGLNFNSIGRSAGVAVTRTTPKWVMLKRGDANNDGAVTIADTLYIAQYLAGMRTWGNDSTQVSPVNAASVRQDGQDGDTITIQDALFIAQMLAGLRDASYNFIP